MSNNSVVVEASAMPAEMGWISRLRECSEVHVWSAWLDQLASSVATFESLLSSDERERVERLMTETDQHRFTVSRGMLRLLLSHYISQSPDHLVFCYGPSGKPMLDRTRHMIPLQFSVSHSEDLALYAFAWNAALGIDVERCRPVSYQEKMVRRFFTPREQEEWKALPDHQRQAGFFRCWTRKEAYLKARGTGLTWSLRAPRKVEVSLAPQEPAALLAVEDDELDRWTIWSLEPAPGFCGALVVEGRSRKMVMMGDPAAHRVISNPSYAAMV